MCLCIREIASTGINLSNDSINEHTLKENLLLQSTVELEDDRKIRVSVNNTAATEKALEAKSQAAGFTYDTPKKPEVKGKKYFFLRVVLPPYSTSSTQTKHC